MGQCRQSQMWDAPPWMGHQYHTLSCPSQGSTIDHHNTGVGKSLRAGGGGWLQWNGIWGTTGHLHMTQQLLLHAQDTHKIEPYKIPVWRGKVTRKFIPSWGAVDSLWLLGKGKSGFDFLIFGQECSPRETIYAPVNGPTLYHTHTDSIRWTQWVFQKEHMDGEMK